MSGFNFKNGDGYIGNIWGRKWTLISLAIILAVFTLAVVRYVIIKPEKLIEPENLELFE